MPEKLADTFKWDIFDVTKVWSHKDFPLVKVGKMTLNRNPENYHAEVEQSAFNPGHFVPGIEPSNDKMLQGRLFSYPDTHRYRLGGNYQHIPINCPYRARVQNGHRDGVVFNSNQGKTINYEPNSYGGPTEDAAQAWKKEHINAECARYPLDYNVDYYAQPRDLWNNVFSDTDRKHWISNMAGPLGAVTKKETQDAMLVHFYKIDPDMGTRLSEAIGVPLKN